MESKAMTSAAAVVERYPASMQGNSAILTHSLTHSLTPLSTHLPTTHSLTHSLTPSSPPIEIMRPTRIHNNTRHKRSSDTRRPINLRVM
jgi:carbohydrate-binding DOMON domain-containing protein